MIEVLAKSDGKSLYEHIRDCLKIFSELKTAIPLLPIVTDLENFWTLLFYTIYIHDWGKCHKEFQKTLNRNESTFWNNQRHELYSVPFIDKLSLEKKYLALIKKAVLGHHKTFKELLEKYKSDDELKTEYELIWKKNINYKKTGRQYHPEDIKANLLNNNLHYEYLIFLTETIKDVYTEFLQNNEIYLTKKIVFKDHQHPVKEIIKPALQDTVNPDNKNYWQNLLLWGTLKLCDHYGSAGINKIYILREKEFLFLNKLESDLKKKDNDFYIHQKRCFNKKGNCILIAPTGSGKTEAAMGWLKNQLLIYQGRAFYILPYTASINAMHKRLVRNFNCGNLNIINNNLIGIQHGKLEQYLINAYESNYVDIKSILNQYKRIIFPLKIITPFQLLKYCYGVKGFEMGFSGLAGAKIIFDEIHAYDEITFAQIISSIKFFQKYLSCQIMVMTATLPSFMLNELKSTLNINEPIQADISLLKNLRRHKIFIKKGDIFDRIKEICILIKQKKRIIIVCNTVKNAQSLFKKIKSKNIIDLKKMTLLHSRFNSFDRNKNELKALDENNQVLIGTQAIEVSLDLDYDIMFTEPAPIDALFQRFGRINRKMQKGLSPVYICEKGSAEDHYIYNMKIVKRTLQLLLSVNIIQEERMQDYLDFVYPNWEAEQEKKYHDTKTNFFKTIKTLRPYERHKENEEEFYSLFDGIKILPISLLEEYKKYIANLNFTLADQFNISVHRGMYYKLKKQNLINSIYLPVNNDKHNIIEIRAAYCKYYPEIGMTEDFDDVDINHDTNFI